MSHPTPYREPPRFGAPWQPNQPPTQQVNPPSSTDGWAIAALVMGIITFMTGLVPLLTLLWGVPGIVVAIVGIQKSAQYRSGRGMAIAGLVLSIIGTLTSITMGLGVILATHDEESSTATTVAVDEPDVGTREKPAPLGAPVSTDHWKVEPNGPIEDVTAAVLEANQFDDDPATGNKYWKVPLTITYTGDDAAGSRPVFKVDADLVGADGNSYDSGSLPLPKGMQDVSDINTMFTGATQDAVVIVEAPADIKQGGAVLVRIGGFDKTVAFFATK